MEQTAKSDVANGTGGEVPREVYPRVKSGFVRLTVVGEHYPACVVYARPADLSRVCAPIMTGALEEFGVRGLVLYQGATAPVLTRESVLELLEAIETAEAGGDLS